MIVKTHLLHGVAAGAVLCLGLSGAAHAQATPSTAELAAQIRQMQAQLAVMQAQLEAQERAQERLATAAQGQVQAAQAEAATVRTELQAAQRTIATIPAPPAYTIVFDGGPRITAGANSVKIRGRLLLDAIRQDIDRPGTAADSRVSQIRGRQAFLGVEGNMGPNWFYKLEGGAVNGGGWAWDDAVVEYRRGPNAVIVGNQKSVGMENITSTRTTSFLDRGPMDSLIDAGFLLGAYYWRTGSNYSFNIGASGQSLNSPDITPAAGSSGQNERIAFSARATVAPVKTDDTVVHLGAWSRYRKRGDDTAFVYAAGYNSPLKVQTPVSTGAFGDHDTALGVEAALVHRSLSLQGEFVNVRTDPVGAGPAADLRAGYAFVSFFPTGEKRAYNVRGEFGRTRVLNPLSDKGFGALELLARYDFADLTDAQSPLGARLANAGTYKAVTLGANWYPIAYVRFMANYTRGQYDNLGAANDADVDLFQLRGQIDW
jgi:phosphate-selective porin OprO/OprP